MLGHSHSILGATATASVLTVMGTTVLDNPFKFVIALSIGTLAALLPDIDSPHNTFRKTLGVGTAQAFKDLRNWRKRNIFQLTIDMLQAWIAIILDFVDHFMPHRGPTHWGITAGIATFAVYWFCLAFNLPHEIWVAFGVGYFSHLLGDGVTKRGVRLFAPVYDRSIRFLPKPLCIRTGTWAESLMLGFLLLLILSAMFWALIN